MDHSGSSVHANFDFLPFLNCGYLTFNHSSFLLHSMKSPTVFHPSSALFRKCKRALPRPLVSHIHEARIIEPEVRSSMADWDPDSLSDF